MLIPLRPLRPRLTILTSWVNNSKICLGKWQHSASRSLVKCNTWVHAFPPGGHTIRKILPVDLTFNKIEHLTSLYLVRKKTGIPVHRWAHVDINGMFRPGRYLDGHVRPIFVKLRSVWDCRLLLSSARKLKNQTERHFMTRDEPLDVTRKTTLNKLKTRALRDGKSVEIRDGQLLVENVRCFLCILVIYRVFLLTPPMAD